MLKDTTPSSCDYPHVAGLLASKKKRDIRFFGELYDPIYSLSSAGVTIAYGLTFYDENFRPFSAFRNYQIPPWWTAYNHVKHTWFECIEEATLANVISALAGLFLLNVLNTSSRLYLIRHQNVIRWDFMESGSVTQIKSVMKMSRMGVSKGWIGYDFTAHTPVFVHAYRSDKTAVAS